MGFLFNGYCETGGGSDENDFSKNYLDAPIIQPVPALYR
jgi:hypothetical protein